MCCGVSLTQRTKRRNTPLLRMAFNDEFGLHVNLANEPPEALGFDCFDNVKLISIVGNSVWHFFSE